MGNIGRAYVSAQKALASDAKSKAVEDLKAWYWREVARRVAERRMVRSTDRARFEQLGHELEDLRKQLAELGG